ncbi:MAG: YlxR family protein [Clostridia bacterium]|nr:YlxR family protein [Clostridia bacterium]
MRNPAKTRTCAGCGKKADKSEFLRIGKAADGTVALNINGRGAYICNSKKCLASAVKKKRIASILRCPVAEEVYNELSNLIGSDEN